MVLQPRRQQQHHDRLNDPSDIILGTTFNYEDKPTSLPRPKKIFPVLLKMLKKLAALVTLTPFLMLFRNLHQTEPKSVSVVEEQRLTNTTSFEYEQQRPRNEVIRQCVAMPECKKEDWTWTEPCTFYESGIGPKPVILMALGRTGSSITWSTMSALTGERNIAFERTGSNKEESQKFFKCLEKCLLAFHNWTTQILCHIQQRRPDVTVNAGIAGFQWKPEPTLMNSEYAVEGLKSIGKSFDPKVKVVYLTRNPLDRKISNLRHDHSKQTNKALPAHCEVNDIKCIKRHASSSAQVGVVLPVGNELIHWLRVNAQNIANTRAALEEAHVDYVHVSYEKLYHSQNASEWMKIFKFLGVGPREDLTQDQILETFDLAPTHSKGRNETVANYKEVENTERSLSICLRGSICT